MKKQLTLYSLLVVVIILWGYIGYNIWQKINNRYEHEQATEISQVTTPEKAVVPEKYDLLLNYSDPFLGSVARSGYTSPKRLSKESDLKLPDPVKKDTFPVVYLGSIRNAESGKLVAHFKHRNQDLMAETDHFVGRYKLISIKEHQVELLEAGKKDKIVLGINQVK